VEAVFFGIPILAYDCIFNRITTENRALWFSDSESLLTAVSSLTSEIQMSVGREMKQIAERQYYLKTIGRTNFDIPYQSNKK
jgi:hypothetical protein